MSRTINITLTEPLDDFVRKQGSQGEYRDAADYVRDVLIEEQARQARADLEEKLVEGVEGPFSDLTSADFAAIHVRARE